MAHCPRASTERLTANEVIAFRELRVTTFLSLLKAAREQLLTAPSAGVPEAVGLPTISGQAVRSKLKYGVANRLTASDELGQITQSQSSLSKTFLIVVVLVLYDFLWYAVMISDTRYRLILNLNHLHDGLCRRCKFRGEGSSERLTISV